MDFRFLDKLEEEYDIVRRKFYTVLDCHISLNEEKENSFKEVSFAKLKKNKHEEYQETPVISWDFSLGQVFENSELPVIMYKKIQTDIKRLADKIPIKSYQEGQACVYHLCFCEELKTLTIEEKKKEWVFVRPLDGYFTIIHEEDMLRTTIKTNKTEVCKKCFETLHLEKLGYRQEEFDLKKFIYEYPPIKSIEIPSICFGENDVFEQDIAPWSLRRKRLLARIYKNTCNRCKVQYKDVSQLEIYHKNKDCLDNRLDNLEILCINCCKKE